MFSFIIPTCIKTILHLNQLQRSIESIRMYHENNKIFLINDSSDTFECILKDLTMKYKNVIIIKTLNNGSADQQVFKCILNIDDDVEHYFIMQDSMILNMQLENVEQVTDVTFLWHFTNHILHWDIIMEPTTEYNRLHNIISHTDLIKHHIINNYNNPELFMNFALDRLNNKNLWCGCFGNCCIITKSFLKDLENKFNFVDKFVINSSNRERRMNESIFALMCHFVLPERNFSNSYDGLYYDGYTTNEYSNQPTGFDNQLYCCKKKYISKISFQR